MSLAMARRGAPPPPSRAVAIALLARLGSLLAHGLSPAEALSASHRGRDAAGRLARSLGRSIARGTALSDAFGRHVPDLLPHEIAVLRAGEQSGCLASSITFLAAWQRRQQQRRSALGKAVAYPLTLLAMAAAAIAFLSLSVVPAFSDLYADNGARLPLPTALLLHLGKGLQAWGATLALALLIAALAPFLAWKLSTTARRRLDRWTLSFPLVGPFVVASTKGAVTSLVALLLGAGCELETAVALAAPVARNSVLRDRVGRLARALRRGRLLGVAWSASGLDADGSETVLLELAEAAGGYGEALSRIAFVNDEEADALLARLRRIAEPAAVVLAAGVVGLGASAVYAPILGSTAALSGGLR
jgi:type II secretory pathway component PulF